MGWVNTPEIVSKLPSRGKLTRTWGGSNVGGSGWRVRCQEISDNFRRSFPEFSEKFSDFPENGPDLLKFSEITVH